MATKNDDNAMKMTRIMLNVYGVDDAMAVKLITITIDDIGGLTDDDDNVSRSSGAFVYACLLTLCVVMTILLFVFMRH